MFDGVHRDSLFHQGIDDQSLAEVELVDDAIVFGDFFDGVPERLDEDWFFPS